MSFGSQDAWLSGRIENATEATRSTYSGKRRGPKGLSESLKSCRYTRLIKPCIPSSDAASLGKVHRWRPCPPAVEIVSNCGGRVFCHSAHTRGVHSLLLPEDHVLNSLTSTKISTAAGRTRNCTLCTMPLRRRGRRISKLSRKCAAIEDRRKVQRSRVQRWTWAGRR